jgi:hypothetical protein
VGHTTVRNANEAENLVSDLDHRFHFRDIVDPHDVSASEDSRRDGRRSRALKQRLNRRFGGLRQKRLARGTYGDWKLQGRQLIEPRQDFRVLLPALSESEARVNRDSGAFYARPYGAMQRSIQIVPDGSNDIFERWKLGPSFRRSAHMVYYQRRIATGRDARELCIKSEARGIVDDLGAMLQSLFRDSRFVGIHRDWDRQFTSQPFQYRDETPQLLGFRNPLGSGARGFRPNIDDVRALFFQFDGAREGTIGIEILATIGKRIRGDVEHSHDQGSLTGEQLALSELPGKVASIH